MTHPRGRDLHRITTIRFQVEASVDRVTACLLEAVRRTDLTLLTLLGDGKSVYPFEAHSATDSASTWRADLLWREGTPDLDWHLEVFVRRAEVFLDCLDGIHVVPAGQRRRSASRRTRHRGAYGLDGAFGAAPE